MVNKSAYESYASIKMLSTSIGMLRMLNNLIGFFSIVIIAYFTWWVWKLSWVGIIVFIFIFWVFNSKILPKIFERYQTPLAQKAKKDLIRLADYEIISHIFANDILSRPVEHWTNHIDRGISKEKTKELRKELESY